jgi:hypothetical protein
MKFPRTLPKCCLVPVLRQPDIRGPTIIAIQAKDARRAMRGNGRTNNRLAMAKKKKEHPIPYRIPPNNTLPSDSLKMISLLSATVWEWTFCCILIW